MKYIDLFLDSRKPLLQPRITVVEEDWQFLERVFPEPGFRSYLGGFIVSKLATELKEHGITSFVDRERLHSTASLAGLLSGIHLVGRPADGNVRRGTGEMGDGVTLGKGESANHACPAGRGHCEEEECGKEEAKPSPAGPLGHDIRK